MSPFDDHYRTLGVHRHAEQAVIEAAYRALARRYHPDLNPRDKAATDRLRSINGAYAVLSNPAARRSYDLSWDAHHASNPSRPSPGPPQPPPKPSASRTKQQTSKTKPPPPPQPTAAQREPGRPWYVKVVGFVVVVALLRAGAGLVGESGAPTGSRPAGQPTARPAATRAVAKAPTATMFAPALDFEQQAAIDASDRSGPTRWGLVETFDATSAWEGHDTELTSSHVDGNGLVLAIKAPGGIDGIVYDGMPTEGKDAAFGVTVGAIDGWGEINLILRSASGAPEWLFAVDPVAREWSLYRTSDTTSLLFYWVEPRPFGAIVPGGLRHIEARITDGAPGLSINGVDVVGPTGIAMPEMPASVVFGMGAGINPESLTGSGNSFSVTFKRAELREL